MAELSKKEIHAITNRFYSCFCGTDISEAESGVTFVCSESRNEELRGLGRRYTIYMLVKDDVCVVSGGFCLPGMRAWQGRFRGSRRINRRCSADPRTKVCLNAR